MGQHREQALQISAIVAGKDRTKDVGGDYACVEVRAAEAGKSFAQLHFGSDDVYVGDVAFLDQCSVDDGGQSFSNERSKEIDFKKLVSVSAV